MTGWLRLYWSRLISGLALTAVAGVAGVVSYFHIYELTLTLHQPVMVARLMPFGVDGLIVAGSVVLLQSAPGQRWLGWAGVGPGVVISLFANTESGVQFGWLAATWAAIPAVAFSLATFVLERWLAGQAAALPRAGTKPDAVPGDVPEPPAGLNGHGHAAAELFAGELAAGTVPGIRRIRREMHLGQPKAQQVREYLAGLATRNSNANGSTTTTLPRGVDNSE